MPAYNLAAARKAIMAECNQQGIDADTRHQLLREVGQVASGSTKDMGADAARRVLNHLRAKSPQPSFEKGGRGGGWAWANAAPPERQKYLWKIRRLLLGAGIAEDRHIAYAEGIARQMAGLNAAGAGPVTKPLPMCDADELWRIVGALGVHLRRKGQDPNDATADDPAHA
jgi:hypothetical protein